MIESDRSQQSITRRKAKRRSKAGRERGMISLTILLLLKIYYAGYSTNTIISLIASRKDS